MNHLDRQWQRLVRSAGPPVLGEPPASARPFFAQRVVHRWLAQEPAAAPGWLRSSRQALALASLAMVASLAVHWHVLRPSASPELSASRAVVSWILPR